MKRQELYHKTVDILVQAYFNDTLQHWNCKRCAVGNIIAANMGYKEQDGYWVDKDGQWFEPDWGNVHTIQGEGESVVYESCYKGLAKIQIDSTGYTFHETAKIEFAFESGHSKESSLITDDEKMFNGLMSVVNCLDEIHENKDSQITQDTKKMFNREQNVAKRQRIVETTAKSRL